MRRECRERFPRYRLQRKSDPAGHGSRHVRHARAVMYVGIANPSWRGKRSRHSWRMRNPQFYVSGKRPMPYSVLEIAHQFLWWPGAWQPSHHTNPCHFLIKNLFHQERSRNHENAREITHFYACTPTSSFSWVNVKSVLKLSVVTEGIISPPKLKSPCTRWKLLSLMLKGSRCSNSLSRRIKADWTDMAFSFRRTAFFDKILHNMGIQFTKPQSYYSRIDVLLTWQL